MHTKFQGNISTNNIAIANYFLTTVNAYRLCVSLGVEYICIELELVFFYLNNHLSFIIIKILLLRYVHQFKSDIINNMDHMRISGTEPSSVILGQTK